MNLIIKFLLAPFALFFLGLTNLRNHLFNIGYTKSFDFEVPVIGVGNLAVGGSGKTPMVEYILDKLLDHHIKPATLSRGYKRQTKGFILASNNDNATTLGDEPYQFYLKYRDKVTVTVGEERALAIPNILFEKPDTQAIVMDDAYQHRYVTPDLSILLTDFHYPFYNDQIMPWGRLRERKKEARRASIIVVSKCEESLSSKTMHLMEEQIKKYSKPDALICFTSISYQTPQPVFPDSTLPFEDNVVLMTGIANNLPLKNYVSGKYQLLDTISYPDHHFYTSKDVKEIVDKLDQQKGLKKTLLTTEKDRAKLLNLQEIHDLKDLSVYYVPIKVMFIKNGKAFDEMVMKAIKNNN